MAAIVVGYFQVNVATDTPPNRLAAALLGAIALFLGIFASFVFTQAASRDAERKKVQVPARASFRRIIAVYGALRAIAERLAERSGALAAQVDADGKVPMVEVRAAMEVIEAHITGQLSTAGVAIEDWRDLIPEDVAEIENQARGQVDGN